MAELRSKKSAVAAIRAALAGRNARRDGRPVTDCPWNPRGDAVNRFLARYWIMGWNRTGRPVQS